MAKSPKKQMVMMVMSVFKNSNVQYENMKTVASHVLLPCHFGSGLLDCNTSRLVGMQLQGWRVDSSAPSSHTKKWANVAKHSDTNLFSLLSCLFFFFIFISFFFVFFVHDFHAFHHVMASRTTNECKRSGRTSAINLYHLEQFPFPSPCFVQLTPFAQQQLVS